jgi:hypothetical protein
MARSTEALIGMAALTLAALTAFTVYRWRMRQRVRAGVEGWLSDRYGGLPKDLTIDSSDDPLWPVLVAFDDPRTGTRHHLQFSCNGRPSTCSPWLIRRAGRRRALTGAGRLSEPAPL